MVHIRVRATSNTDGAPLRGRDARRVSRASLPRTSMMSRAHHAALPVRDRDADVLHHALVLVDENVTVEDEVADVALISRTHDDDVVAGRRLRLLDEQRVFPHALEIGVLRIVR